MSATITKQILPPSVLRKLGPAAGVVSFGFPLLWLLASVFVHVLPHEPPDRVAAPLFRGAEITPAVAGVFTQACANCHSEKTTWPWYSRVAPVSWLVETDVKRARAHLNLSRWDSLDETERRLRLTAIATVIENREMPPHKYVVLHPEARLSAEASARVIEWTRAERRRLRASVSNAPAN